jgi:hypothetical protein
MRPRLRRGQVPGHLRHHLAKFIRFVTRAAQNRHHHRVRQKIVERRPGAVASGAPELCALVSPRASNSISVSGQSSII